MSKAQKILKTYLIFWVGSHHLDAAKDSSVSHHICQVWQVGLPFIYLFLENHFWWKNNSIKTKILFGPQKMSMAQKIIKT